MREDLGPGVWTERDAALIRRVQGDYPSENPGGWPTGPLETRSMYDRRDLCNLAADARDDILDRLATAVGWIVRRLP